MSLKGVSSMRLHRDLSITQKSARFMARYLRAAWPSGTPVRMEGPGADDEACVGGREADKHARKRLKAGRGAVGRTGVPDWETNTVQMVVVAKNDAKTLRAFVNDRTADDTTISTDEASAYRSINCNHETASHSVEEEVHTNGMESFRAVPDQAHKGVFHSFGPKHRDRNVDGFANRRNLRLEATEVIMAETVARMIGERLMYRLPVVDGGLPSGARS